jgi:hypothetical protein
VPCATAIGCPFFVEQRAIQYCRAVHDKKKKSDGKGIDSVKQQTEPCRSAAMQRLDQQQQLQGRQFQGPSGIAFDADGHIVVVEQRNCRVQVLRYSDGAHVRTIGSRGSDNEEFSNPAGGIAIDSDGRMVVADSCNHRVQVLE